MAVTKVSEQWEGRYSAQDEQGNVIRKRQWKVQTDAQADDASVVVAAVGINQYDPHPDYPPAIARTFTCAPHEGPYLWLVDIGYSSAPMAARSGDMPEEIDPEDPTPPSADNNNSAPAPLRLPEYSFARRDNKIAPEEDANGVPCVNTAGDRIEGLEVDRPFVAIAMKFWSLKITVAHILDCWDTINDDDWKGFPIRKLKVENFEFKAVYDLIAPGVFALVQEATITLLYNRDRWIQKVLNAGKREKVSTPGGIVLRVITDDTGQPVTDPVPLLASGARWRPGDAYHYLEFQFNPDKDFDTLIPS
ncbi:MAG: hypothetical protein ABI780_02655 [Ardenticatenales bacterium]